jgi:O-methyltransferase domain
MRSVLERDWKYLKSIQNELLNRSCERANKESLRILSESSIDSFKRYRRLYDQIKDSDRRVTLCFDDWRRSTVFQRLMCIISENLLTDEERRQLSQETQDSLEALQEVLGRMTRQPKRCSEPLRTSRHLLPPPHCHLPCRCRAVLHRRWPTSEVVCERKSIEAGDFFKTVPAGGDAYLPSHIIHAWSEDQCLTILGHCRKAMEPNGRLRIIEMVLPAGDTPLPGLTSPDPPPARCAPLHQSVRPAQPRPSRPVVA